MPGYDHLLLDIDGTLLIGEQALPGAGDAVVAARSAGIGLGFLTNDPVSSRDAQAERLRAAGVAADADEIITSARATAWLVADELGPVPVLLLGSPGFEADCREAGLIPVETAAEARAVLLGGSRDLTFGDLTEGVRAVLVHGAALYGSNRDATFPAPGGPAPAAGALVAAAEYATARTARCAGKPEAAMFEEARRILGDGRYLVVGDRLDADVAGGAAADMETALVLSGSTSRADVEAWTGVAPDAVLEGIADLAALLDGAARPR